MIPEIFLDGASYSGRFEAAMVRDTICKTTPSNC